MSSPMTSRTLSGVASLRSGERTGSLPEERFMNVYPSRSGDTQQSLALHLERRNSLPCKEHALS